MYMTCDYSWSTNGGSHLKYDLPFPDLSLIRIRDLEASIIVYQHKIRPAAPGIALAS